MALASTLAVVVLTATSVAAGGVAGVVTDAGTGRPLAGAVVALDDLGRAAVTDDAGWYWLTGVPPGPQHLSVGVLGYRSRSVHVLVPAGEVLRIDLALETEPIEVDAVFVRGRIPLRGAERDAADLRPDRVLSTAAIRNDPFAAEQDPLEALVGGPVARDVEAVGGLHVRGGAVDQVGYALDGFPVFSPYHAGFRASAWSPEAVGSIALREGPALATEALSGVVEATTVEPASRLRAGGTASTSHLRVSLDGPLTEGRGFLLAGRIGYPGSPFHSREPSYLRGEDHDLVAKIQARVGEGRVWVTAFDNRNDIRASAGSTEVGVPVTGWNAFMWSSGTIGLGWEAPGEAGARWAARAWRAVQETSARWRGADPALADLESEREQFGAWGSVRWGDPDRPTELGLRVVRDDLAYLVRPREDAEPAFRRREAIGSLGVYAKAVRPVGPLRVGVEAMGRIDDEGAHWMPRLDVEWRPAGRLGVFARYVRSIQRAQSLRNPESVVDRIFPPELPVVGDASRVARSHTGVVGLVAVPWTGSRLVAEAYARSLDGLALVAVGEGRPYATSGIAYGSATVRGAGVEWAASAARYGVVGSWGIERVETTGEETEWAPGWAARHRARIGGVLHVSPTFSVRLAWVGAFGRRGTDTIGVLEWEACNLLDEGCEFAGTPERLGPLGARELPAYHRLDLSVRKHWHPRLLGREARLEAFASGSNLLGRENVLGYVVDPETGEARPLEMRPAAPVAAGVEWSF